MKIYNINNRTVIWRQCPNANLSAGRQGEYEYLAWAVYVAVTWKR